RASSRARKLTASACSTRTEQVPSFTAIPVTRAAPNRCLASIITSILCPKVAMKTPYPFRWPGFVIREFARQNTPVRALVRSRARARALEILPTVKFVEADMLRPETLGAALDGVDRVLMISSPDPRMVETQCTFIDASKKAGVRHIVKFSGAESGVGFNPKAFRFTRMHEQIERYLEG